MAAALPKVPMHALKLGDRISPTGVARGRATGYRYAHSSSDMAPPVRFGEMVQPGRFSAQSKHSQQAFLFEVLCFEHKGDYQSATYYRTGHIPEHASTFFLTLVLES